MATNTKKIQQVVKGAQPHMVGDGFRMSNYIPGNLGGMEATSPFIMLDYGQPFHFPASAKRKGVGEHPHRGFETVTLVYEGNLEHRDSSGGGGKIGPGDVQWMTAAGGVLHDEFQSDEFSKTGGIQHMIQLWVNLPAKDKMSKPKYQSITAAQIPNLKLDDKGSYARVIAGNLNGTQGPATTFTTVEMYDLHLETGAETSFDIPASHNAMLLVTKGSATVNGDTTAMFTDMVVFAHAGETITVKADEPSSALVLAGEPINEPVVQYGPFVMNTRQEIVQAVDDFNAGKFGKLN